ncbi:hypothetical protein BHM03_00024321 [Ensete ventricosum]|nr:hypothetical protein BHM03_00024321 [Ensete ventricosum]
MEVLRILASCPLTFLYFDGLKRIKSSLLNLDEEEGNVKQGKQRPSRKRQQLRERLAVWLQVTKGWRCGRGGDDIDVWRQLVVRCRGMTGGSGREERKKGRREDGDLDGRGGHGWAATVAEEEKAAADDLGGGSEGRKMAVGQRGKKVRRARLGAAEGAAGSGCDGKGRR